MAIIFSKINNVSAETKSAISRKSAQTLPNNPSERGYSAEEIKRRLYQPILDAANSALAEIDRVVNEANLSFSQVSDELDNFIDTTKIQEAYKVELDATTWVFNDETNMYEVIIPQEKHQISDYKEIGVNMFLLDGEGKYIQVNQFEVDINGNVRCFHETNGAGYLSIYVKREGFIIGNTVVDADHIIGLAKVGRTNSFNDLDDQPNLEQMNTNSVLISKIASGEQMVGRSVSAKSCDTATYAKTSGASQTSEKATTATRAISDENGVSFVTGYARNIGNYPDMTVGEAKIAQQASNIAVYKELTIKAEIYARDVSMASLGFCGYLTLKGYGIRFYNSSNNSVYWAGNLYATSYDSWRDDELSKITDVKLTNITNIERIVSGGVLALYDEGHLYGCSLHSLKMEDVTNEVRYFPICEGAWLPRNYTNFSITNFIAKIE